MKKDFISIEELSTEEIYHIFDQAERLREEWGRSKQPPELLQGKSMGLIFEKRSTRTRISFEIGAHQLGIFSLFLSPQDIHLGTSESLEDTARVLSRYVDGVVLRTYSHSTVVEFAACSSVPVINGLTNLLHPCQAMADYYTLWRRGQLGHNTRVVYMGDGNNVCNSLMLGASKIGIDLVVCTPEAYRPPSHIWDKVMQAGARVQHVVDPRVAARGADVLYTDVWTSMGQEQEEQERLRVFGPYQINEHILALASKNAVVMHCLPAHRGQEITDAVMDSPQSIIWDQAENRLHIQKALLATMLGGLTGQN